MDKINSGDTAFVLIAGALVAFMTPGLAFFYGGLVRRKNVLAIMMQSFIAMGVVTAVWVLGGFSLAFGPTVGGVIGNMDFALLKHVGIAPNPDYGPTIPFLTFFGYQEMFAIITPALITGAFADRVNFKAYLFFLVAWSLLIYCPFAHWVWGANGFMHKWGLVDFAGGIVVHVSAGVAALASVFFVGKRQIKKGENVAPHNITFVALGTGLLWFGWFGFNAGSALAANGIAATAFVNTDIAGSTAMITWLFVAWHKEKKPSMVGALTGAVAGLATITPCAGYVEPWAAALIGVLTSLICYGAVQFRMKKDWDDALDVWGVHGVGGIFGTICVGIFASKTANPDGVNGLLRGDTHQFLVQVGGVAICTIYAFVVTMVILKVISMFMPVRVPPEAEEKGLDAAVHGESAYELGG
ncbi:MAG: ammonium transporter [Deltaproteobacteria bacterium]|nr:ammonium transporter [Deltaproteobacteria bacterium]